MALYELSAIYSCRQLGHAAYSSQKHASGTGLHFAG